MYKKLVTLLFCCFIVSLIPWRFALASIIINEVMYDVEGTDTNHEWVEIYNSGGSEIDLTGWKFYDGSNHNFNIPPANGGQGSIILPSGGYAVLSGNAVTFLADYPLYSGTVIDTVMTLNNASATLKILQSDNSEEDSFVYDSSLGANGDGSSLQLVNSSWIASTPTPGSANSSSGGVAPSGGPLVEESSSSSSFGAGPIVTKDIEKDNEYELKIITKSLVFSKTPFSILGVAYDGAGNQVYSGRYFWNFGDGTSKEIINNTYAFSHTYFYEGDYDIYLEYYSNSYNKIPDATKSFTIKVIPIDVVISKVGTEQDFFITLTNNSSYQEDISSWFITSLDKKFVLPQKTIIPPKRSIILSPSTTQFIFSDRENLKLHTDTGSLVFDYGVSTFSSPKVSVLSISTPKSVVPSVVQVVEEEEILVEENPQIDNGLIGTAIESGIVEKTNTGSFVYIVSFIVLLLGSAGAVYFIRQNKTESVDGEDFELIDE